MENKTTNDELQIALKIIDKILNVSTYDAFLFEDKLIQIKKTFKLFKLEHYLNTID